MLHPIHRWLTDLEHTACGLRRTRGRRRPLVVRGWPDVTCQRCLGSIHFKLEQLQRQPPGRPAEPQGPPAGSDKQVMLCPGFLVEIMLKCKRLRSTSALVSITSVALPKCKSPTNV